MPTQIVAPLRALIDGLGNLVGLRTHTDGDVELAKVAVYTAAQFAGLPVAQRVSLRGATVIDPSSPYSVLGVVDGSGNLMNGFSQLRFAASGNVATPLATFDGAGSSGKFALSADILIPANTLVAGTGRIKGKIRVRKVGTDAASFIGFHFGPANSTADANLFSASAPAFTAVNPSDFDVTLDSLVTATTISTTWQVNRLNVGLTSNVSERTTNIDLTVANYLNIVISGATASNTYSLIGYEFEVFR